MKKLLSTEIFMILLFSSMAWGGLEEKVQEACGELEQMNKGLYSEKGQKQQADACRKMTEGRLQWKNGILDKAVSMLKEAANIDSSNRQIAKVLKAMQYQKKKMDNTLKKTNDFIGQRKFMQAESALVKAGYISKKYLPYIEMEKKLKHARKVHLRSPKSGDLAYAKGFAGKWNSTYGVMKLTVQGLHISGNYTHDKGRIEAVLSQDGKTMKGTWAEAPSYGGASDAGKMYFKLSSDKQKINGLWSYGDEIPTGSWTATRIVDTKNQSPAITGQSPTKNIKPMAGYWDFSYFKKDEESSNGHICDLKLTDNYVKEVGYKIQYCRSSESYWLQVEDELLVFLDINEEVTTIFTEIEPGYWKGQYVGTPMTSKGIVRYLKRLNK